MAIAAFVVSIVAALAAVLAGIFTWRSAASAERSASAAEQAAKAADRSAEAAERSAAADERAVRLDHERRHTELTPDFTYSIDRLNSSSQTHVLTVQLMGPSALDHLDELSITIRDENPARAYAGTLPGGPTPEQIKEQIWGRFAFIPHSGPDVALSSLNGADSTGRTTTTSGVAVGERLIFQLKPTLPPHWMSQDQEAWSDSFDTLRLTLTCGRDGWERWILREEVELPRSPRITVF